MLIIKHQDLVSLGYHSLSPTADADASTVRVPEVLLFREVIRSFVRSLFLGGFFVFIIINKREALLPLPLLRGFLPSFFSYSS